MYRVPMKSAGRYAGVGGGAFTVVRCRDADCTCVRPRDIDGGISVVCGGVSGQWVGASSGLCAAELIRRGGF